MKRFEAILSIGLLAAVQILCAPTASLAGNWAEFSIAQAQFPPPPTPRGGGQQPMAPAAPAGPASQPAAPPMTTRPAAPQQPAPAGQNVVVTLTNGLGQRIDYYYIDGAGQAQYIGALQPGEQVPQESRPGLELVFGVDGQEVANYFTSQDPEQSFTIGQPTPAMAPPGLQTTPVSPLSIVPPRFDPASPPQTGMPPSRPGNPAVNAGPSFDCNRAGIPAERTICADSELSEWDRQMADTYQWLRTRLAAGEQGQLAQDQRRWLAQRNRCGASRDCLIGLYLDRIAYLNEYHQPGEDAASDVSFPIAAKSWGGIVRSGPGTDHRRLDSLREGERISLLERTDVYRDKWPWFRIRYRGKVGFQWGGIICGIDRQIPGAFEICR